MPMGVIEKFARKVVTAQPMQSLAEVARLMEQDNVGAVVIAENRRPVGILTDRDLALELGSRSTSPKTPAVKVMNSPVQTVGVNANVFEITQLLREGAGPPAAGG
jgi:CBS domain-containing protein